MPAGRERVHTVTWSASCSLRRSAGHARTLIPLAVRPDRGLAARPGADRPVSALGPGGRLAGPARARRRHPGPVVAVAGRPADRRLRVARRVAAVYRPAV